MSTLRRFAVTLVAIAGTLLFTQVPAFASPAEAGKFIESLAGQTLKTISDPSLQKDQKQAKLEKIFGDNIDFPWVSRFVMGTYWRQATDEQKSRYMKAHQKFLLLHYTSRFAEYTSGDYKITGTRDDGNNEYTVNMQIKSDEPNAEPVMVDYRVRQGSGGLKVFDILVEGVSMITTQRAEFASVISKGGIDSLIEQLETKNKTGDIDMANGH